MPVILTKQLAEEWIKDDLSEEQIKKIATYQYPAEQMSAHTVAKDFQENNLPKTRHTYPEFAPGFCK